MARSCDTEMMGWGMINESEFVDDEGDDDGEMEDLVLSSWIKVSVVASGSLSDSAMAICFAFLLFTIRKKITRM